MSELNDLALDELASAMAATMTDDPEKQVLIATGLRLIWPKSPPPSEPPKTFRPRTLKLIPIAKPESWDKAEEYRVIDFHYLVYHASHLRWLPEGRLQLWASEDVPIYQLTGDLAVEFWNWFTGGIPVPTFPSRDPVPREPSGTEPEDTGKQG